MTADPLPHSTPKQARIAITVFFFVSGFTYATWASRIPTIQQQLHLNEAQLGTVLFALPAGLMLTLPVTGYLLRHYSSRYIMLAGALLFNAMMCLLGFAAFTWQLVIVLFCFGSSRNLMNISMNAQSINVQSLYNKSIIAGFHGVWSIAGFAAAALGSFMVSLNVDPAWHFLSVSIVLTALILYFFPHSIHQQPVPHERKSRFSFPDRSLLKYGFICFASMACEGTMYDWSAIYMQKAVHTTQSVATTAFAIYMVAMTLGRLTGDKLANRFGIKLMLWYSGIFIGSGLLLSSIFPYPVTVIIGFMMTGFGVSCVVPMVFSMAGRSTKLSSGPAIAAVSTVGYTGFLIVPPTVGFIAQLSDLRWSFGIMACFGLLITWLVAQLQQD